MNKALFSWFSEHLVDFIAVACCVAFPIPACLPPVYRRSSSGSSGSPRFFSGFASVLLWFGGPSSGSHSGLGALPPVLLRFSSGCSSGLLGQVLLLILSVPVSLGNRENRRTCPLTLTSSAKQARSAKNTRKAQKETKKGALSAGCSLCRFLGHNGVLNPRSTKPSPETQNPKA